MAELTNYHLFSMAIQKYNMESFEESEEICSECGQEKEPIYENQGWDGYFGPRFDEIVGYKPCPCTLPEYEPDEL